MPVLFLEAERMGVEADPGAMGHVWVLGSAPPVTALRGALMTQSM